MVYIIYTSLCALCKLCVCCTYKFTYECQSTSERPQRRSEAFRGHLTADVNRLHHRRHHIYKARQISHRWRPFPRSNGQSSHTCSRRLCEWCVTYRMSVNIKKTYIKLLSRCTDAGTKTLQHRCQSVSVLYYTGAVVSGVEVSVHLNILYIQLQNYISLDLII